MLGLISNGMMAVSLFVLGGEFRDKMRSLFVHGAVAQFPEAYPLSTSVPGSINSGSGMVFMIVTANGPGQRVQQRLVVDRFAKKSRGPGPLGRRARFFGILC